MRRACSLLLSCVPRVSVHHDPDIASQNAFCYLVFFTSTTRAEAALSSAFGVPVSASTSSPPASGAVNPSCPASVSSSENGACENSTVPAAEKIKQCWQGPGPDRSPQLALASRYCFCSTAAWHGNYLYRWSTESGATSTQHPRWGWQTAQQVKVLVAKLGNLSFISGTHTVDSSKLSSDLQTCSMVPAHPCP